VRTVSKVPYDPVQNARQGFFEAEQWMQIREHLPPHMAASCEFQYQMGWRIHGSPHAHVGADRFSRYDIVSEVDLSEGVAQPARYQPMRSISLAKGGEGNASE
jgi:hypothetical protein